MVQFRVFTILMHTKICKTTKIWCFDVIFDVTSLMTLSRQNSLHLNIHTWQFPNYSENYSFKPFRSYSLFFFELYIYIIGFLETLYTSDVTNSGTHSLGYSVLFASILVNCPTLKIHNFSGFDSFYMRFFLLSSYG